MKSLLFYVFILLPSILFGQDDLKKSAEDFMKGYYKLFEEKKWNLVTETYAEDAQVVWMNGMVLSLYEMMKPVLEKNKTEMTSDKVDVKWILSDITGPNSVLVTTRYIEATDRTGNTAAIFKAGNAINHGWVLILSMIEHFKNAGISPAESGKMIGARFAKTWDPSMGFEALASGFNWGLQIMSTYVEVLERNNRTFKAKFLSPATYESWNVTKEDLLVCSQNTWQEIADYMGGICSLTEDGNYWIITMTKKPD